MPSYKIFKPHNYMCNTQFQLLCVKLKTKLTKPTLLQLPS